MGTVGTENFNFTILLSWQKHSVNSVKKNANKKKNKNYILVKLYTGNIFFKYESK